MLLTRSPLSPRMQAPLDPVRLACVKHAASVHPEPGSNSPTKTKNIGSSQKTIQQKQTPTIKKQNVPKSSASKKQKTEKTKTPNQTARHPSQSHTNKTKKTHYREHKQPNHKPTKLAGQDSSRAKNNRRKTRFPPASSLSNEYKVTAPTSTGQTRLGKSKRHHNSSDFHRFSHYGVERVADF